VRLNLDSLAEEYPVSITTAELAAVAGHWSAADWTVGRSVGLLLPLSVPQRLAQISHQHFSLFLFRRRNHRPQAVDDVLRLAEVNLVQRVAYLVLHVLHMSHTHVITELCSSHNPG